MARFWDTFWEHIYLSLGLVQGTVKGLRAICKRSAMEKKLQRTSYCRSQCWLALTSRTHAGRAPAHRAAAEPCQELVLLSRHSANGWQRLGAEGLTRAPETPSYLYVPACTYIYIYMFIYFSFFCLSSALSLQPGSHPDTSLFPHRRHAGRLASNRR